MKNHKDEITDKIFEYYKDNCLNIHGENAQKLDELVKAEKYAELINLIRSAGNEKTEFAVVDAVKKIITDNINKDLKATEIARIADLGESFLEYLFKTETATTIEAYKEALKEILKERK